MTVCIIMVIMRVCGVGCVLLCPGVGGASKGTCKDLGGGGAGLAMKEISHGRVTDWALFSLKPFLHWQLFA